MTGYGRGEADTGTLRVVVEAKSVNHRYLDVRVALPRGWAALEAGVTAAVKERLGRGRVEVSAISERSAEGAGAEVVADLGAARELLGALHDVQNGLGLSGDVTISDMSALAERFLVRSEGPAADEVAGPLNDAVHAALDGLIAARAAEGQALCADLIRQAEALEAGVQAVTARLPGLVEEGRIRLRDRLDKLLAPVDVTLAPERLEQEIALLADRTDVNEELQRLSHHLGDLRARLDAAGDEPMGRRIDFLAQELGREVNTVGSKISDPEVSAMVVEMKTAVERIREQVANLE